MKKRNSALPASPFVAGIFRRPGVLPLLLFVLSILLGGFFLGGKVLASTLQTDEAEDIGKYDDTVGGYSYVGIKAYWEDELECFALDTYQKNTYGAWKYVISNINGEQKSANYTLLGTPISVYSTNDSLTRFKLKVAAVTIGREDFSYYLERYYKGKLISNQYGITGVPYGELGCTIEIPYALDRNEFIYLSGHNAESDSYIYRIYDPCIIEPDGDELSLNAYGGSIDSVGKAYVCEEGLRLAKLPVASMKKEGYTCQFEGWYSAAEGGRKYAVGDILQKGEVFHARWNITPNPYTVTCVDIRGNSPEGVVLGQRTWQADFGSEASASKAGTNTGVSAYYPNCRYVSSTAAKVTTSGATVYRYFSYATYPVEYVDKITGGSRAGEVLNTQIEEREYNSTVYGSDIGVDHTPNTYYEGYYYDTCSAMTVQEQGTVVYRFFKPVQYTIVLDGNGATDGIMTTVYDCEYDTGVTVKKNRFEKRSTVTLYQNAAKKPEETSEMTVKQTFLGWSLEKNGPVRYLDNETLLNLTNQQETVVLYAVWSEETLELPVLADTLEYHFLGWAKDAAAKTGVSKIAVADSMELYGIWENRITKYHVEYYKENLAGEYELASSYSFDGYINEEISLESLDTVYPGFSLDKASSTLTGVVKQDGSLILCAYYRRNSYSFAYDLNGGSLRSGEGLPAEKIKFGMNLTLASVVPQREGYLFLGWCQESDDTHTLFQPNDSYVMQNHDVTMHAQWRKLYFPVKYDNNAAFSGMPGITGEVPDTDYIYQKDAYASRTVFQSEYGEVVAWNTKPDGSGITVLPGANIKGLFDSVSELTLYAIWEWKSGEYDASFCLRLWKETDGQREELETLKLHGKAGEKISIALLRLYQRELQGESVIYFYKGYEVVNTDALEQLISLDSGTDISLELKDRDYKITFQFGEGEDEESVDAFTGKYQEPFTLPSVLPNGIEADRYEDNLGNHWFPGDTIIPERNMKLYVQHAIRLHDEIGAEKETIEYVTHGRTFTFPELARNGYRFLGWYTSMGELAGKAGDILSKVMARCDYYAGWSDPLTYTITFDLGTTGVRILENQVFYHQYTKETVLPDKNQVIVPDGYRFEGWYDSTDESKTLVTKIAATEYGDRVFRPLLTNISADGAQGSTDGKDTEGDKNGAGDTAGNGGSADNGNQSGSGNQTGDGNTSGSGTDGDNNGDGTGIFAGNDDKDNEDGSGIKKQPNSGETALKGKVFWKKKLKYKILSVQEGKARVKVISARKSMKKLKIPSKVVYAGVSYRVTVIGKKAFTKAKKVKKAVVGNSVVRIRKRAFAGMKKLQKATLGKKIKRIDTGAFQKDKKLSVVVIKSKKIKKLGKKAFYSMNGYGNIQIPKGKKPAYQKLLVSSGLKKGIQIKGILIG